SILLYVYAVLYSIDIKQYALSKEEYEYLSKIKNNSETTGSIFDKQPSELVGNIHCLTIPGEPVIGFMGIANRPMKRYWIKNSDVPNWNYFLNCASLVISGDSASYYPEFVPLWPTRLSSTGRILNYLGAEGFCADCTTRGVNVKPSFWP